MPAGEAGVLYSNGGPTEFFETPWLNPGTYMYNKTLYARLLLADENLSPISGEGELASSYEKPGSSQMMSKRLRELKVACLEHMTIVRLLKEGERVCGALAVKRKDEGLSLVEILSPAVILATGGMGGLFTHRLTTDDVTGIGQYLALESGAKLFNLEFMQMMLGHVHPASKTIYNEKMFRFSRFYGADKELFSEWEGEEREKQLELRSGGRTLCMKRNRRSLISWLMWTRKILPHCFAIRY